MALLLVTCPESAHLEQIEYEVDVLGMLLVGCTAFGDGCSIDCPRTCAKHLDRRRFAKQQATVGRVLLARSCLRFERDDDDRPTTIDRCR
jgi:hypothetical protein